MSDKRKVPPAESYIDYNFTRLIQQLKFMQSDLYFINLI